MKNQQAWNRGLQSMRYAILNFLNTHSKQPEAPSKLLLLEPIFEILRKTHHLFFTMYCAFNLLTKNERI